MRYAIIAAPKERVEAYLPANYSVITELGFDDSDPHRLHTLIGGTDNAGWTLDGYVLPRLASGLYFGTEVTVP